MNVFITPLNRFLAFLSIVNHLLMIQSYGTVKSEPMGLLWSGQNVKNQSGHRAKVERELTDQVENQFERRLLKGGQDRNIPAETIRLTKVRQRVFELNERLFRAALNQNVSSKESVNAGEKIRLELNSLASRLPRGTFGPEIQLSRLSQAVWFWKNGNLNKFKRLYKEALDMHPLREIEYPNFIGEAFVDVIESDFHRSLAIDKEKTCPFPGITNLEIGDRTWINGFKINNHDIEIYPGNYFVIRRDKKGNLFEKILSCTGANQIKDVGAWMPVKNQVRLEHLIPSEFDRIKDLLILAEEPTGLRAFHFNRVTGLSDWPSDSGEAPSESLAIPYFQIKPDKKWYNKSGFWWLAGAVLASGVFMLVNQEPHANNYIRLKFKGGP